MTKQVATLIAAHLLSTPQCCGDGAHGALQERCGGPVCLCHGGGPPWPLPNSHLRLCIDRATLAPLRRCHRLVARRLPKHYIVFERYSLHTVVMCGEGISAAGLTLCTLFLLRHPPLLLCSGTSLA